MKLFAKSGKFVREVFLSVLFKGINILIQFLTTIFIARGLGAEGYGVYALAVAAISILAIPVQSGLGQVAMRETARVISDIDESAFQSKLVEILKVHNLFGLGVLFLASMTLPAFGMLVDQFSYPVIILTVAIIPLRGSAGFFAALMRGMKKAVESMFFELIVQPLCFLLFVVSLVLTFMWSADGGSNILKPEMVLGLQLASVVIVWVMLNRLVATELKQMKVGANPIAIGFPEIRTAQMWLAPALRFSGLDISWWLISQSSVILMAFWTSSEVIGLFRLAFQVAMLTAFMATAVNMVVGPKLAQLSGEGRWAEIKQLVEYTCWFSLGLATFVLVALLIGGPVLLVRIFGPDFEAAFPFLMILLFGSMAMVTLSPVALLLNMTGLENLTFKTTLWAAVFNLILGAVLIPVFGGLGGAVATTLSLVLRYGLLYRPARVLLERHGVDLSLLRGGLHLMSRLFKLCHRR